MINKTLVTIKVEEYLMISRNVTIPYNEFKEIVKILFHSFRIVQAKLIPKNTPILNPFLSYATKMVAKTMLKQKFQVGKGLGVKL